MRNIEKLASQLQNFQTFQNEPLSNHTTLRIGGPADLLYRAKTTFQLSKATQLARSLNIPVTILGWGSNVLVGDGGIRGLVIKNEVRGIKIGKVVPAKRIKEVEKARWQSDKSKGSFKYEFGDLNYDEVGFPRVKVSISSGVPLQMALNELLERGITGLQWYSRIPGTIGGAVFNNIHGGTHFISEVVNKVKVLDPDGNIKVISGDSLMMAYDKSRFHSSGEVILEVEFELYKGDVAKARETANEWARRKNLQPPRSAGCTFKNISLRQQKRLDLPTTSAGYIIEHVLKLGGKKIGGAMISTAHHNFIVNTGGASAKDYLKMVNLIKEKARNKLGIRLTQEIILLGKFID